MALIIILLVAFVKMEAISFECILVTTDRDTINCEILFAQASFYAYRGDILSSKKITVLIDGQKTTYGPEQLVNYSILYANSWKTYWSVNTRKKKYEFMKREVEGKVSLYSNITYNSIQLRYDRQYMFVKTASQDNLYLHFNTTKNRQKIIDFLVECTQVTSLLYAREIKVDVATDWKLIAQKYNENC